MNKIHKRLISFTFFILINTVLFSQNLISLDSCIFYAENHFPILKNNILNNRISDLQIKNLSANFFPEIYFEAKASYQSQTIDLDINTQGIPANFNLEFPVPPLDQYAMTLNISQTIYDGGSTKYLKQAETRKLQLQNLNNKISFYRIKKQLNNIYFGILILQKTEEQINGSLSELQEKYTALKSALKNGVISPDNLDLLSVNILKIKQKLSEIQENINNGYTALSILTGKDYTSGNKLKVPKNIELIYEINRPETEIFNIQNELSDVNIKLINSKNMPKFGVFAVGGYGNPGLTLIKDEWNPYFIIGAKLRWNVWDRNQSSKEKQILNIKKNTIDNQKDAFNQSVDIRAKQLVSEIKKYEKLLKYDNEITALQDKICKTTGYKLQNGTANSVDYISVLNAKEQANIQYEIHKLKILKYKYEYFIVTGNK